MTRYDVAEHLRAPVEAAAYVEACLEEAGGDSAFIAKALGDIARRKAGSKGSGAVRGTRPDFETILKVIVVFKSACWRQTSVEFVQPLDWMGERRSGK